MPQYNYKGYNIFYEDQGSGQCLLYIHEWNASSVSFRKVNQKYLDKKIRVISIDLPGYGNSNYVIGMQFDDFSDILVKLLDYLQIQGCTFMGFCLGSAIVLDFYFKYPERVKKIIFVEPVLKFPKILIPLLIPGFGTAFLNYMANHRFLYSLASTQLIGPNTCVNKQIFIGIGRNNQLISVKYLRLLFKKSYKSNYRNMKLDLETNCICISGENTISLFKKSAVTIINHFHIKDHYTIKNTRHYALMEQPAEISSIILAYLEHIEGSL
jgi:pimeloyl-ACP methyl ester carboxylesterase